jgi:hypothetical protein
MNESEVRPQTLAAVRIIFSLWVLYESFGEQFLYFQIVEALNDKSTLLPDWLGVLISENINLLLMILRVSAVLALVGFLTSTSMMLLSGTYFLVYSWHYTNFDAPVPWIYAWFPLIILAFSHCGDVWSLDKCLFKKNKLRSNSNYGWPLDILRIWFVYIYFSAGLSKLLPLSEVLYWIQNSPTQEILVYRYPHSMSYYTLGKPIFDYSQPFAGHIIAIGAATVMILELSTLLLLFTYRFDSIIITLIFCMHSLMWFVGIPNFGLASFVLMSSIFFPKLYRSKVSRNLHSQ